MAGSPTHRRLRAPRRDGEALIDPPLAQMPAALDANRQSAARFEYDFQGRSFAELARTARRGLLDAARQYTGAYRDIADDAVLSDENPILLSGHQPELFHPGVWFKNFALSSVGQSCRATAISLLIDNDVCHAPAIRIPTGSVQQPQLAAVAYDRATGELPLEERSIVDVDTFASFAERVRQTVAPFVARPLVSELWPDAVSAVRRTGNLGRSLAEARHRLEGRWGLNTLETPLGEVCEQPAFRWFTVHLLAQLPRFHHTYNTSLAEYRATAGIRSHTHPVPELVREDDWLEAPFWIWTRDDPRRRRLFARPSGRRIELTDRHGVNHSLPLSADQSADQAVERLTELASAGVRIRPRALITTMFARLLLGDYFLHGIGGAKYDELTDRIIARFFQREPPAYGTLTATLRLPVVRPSVSEDDVRRVERDLRDLRFNPDRHLPPGAIQDETIAALVAQKRHWLAVRLPKGERLERHRALAEVNKRLGPSVGVVRDQLHAEREILVESLRIARLLGSREFSFCLFPEETLRTQLLELSTGKPYSKEPERR